LARRHRLVLQGVKAGYEDPLSGRRGSARASAGEMRRLRAGLMESLCSDLEGITGGRAPETTGDLFLLVNESTLGVAEDEILFHMRHVAEEILEAEAAARAEWRRERAAHIEDRIGRALGVAAGARLLSFQEGMDLLSSLRLGVAAGILADHSVPEINGLLLRAQRAHLELAVGHDCDELAAAVERANLFRARFGA